MQKAKALQKMDSVLKEEANKNAFQTFSAGASAKSNETKKATEDKRMENQAGTQRFEVTGDNPNPWSTEEQQLLEQALKTYPASLGAERCVIVTLRKLGYGTAHLFFSLKPCRFNCSFSLPFLQYVM